MRGLKVKTLRRVARETQIDPLVYGVKTHNVLRMVQGVNGKPELRRVERFQLVMGRCQRKMVKHLKRICPKNGFFLGMTLRQFRGKAVAPGMENMTVRAFATEAEARAAA